MNKFNPFRRSVAGITAGLTKQVAQLRTLADNERAEAERLLAKAQEAVVKADASRKEAFQADKVANRIEALVV